MANDLFRLNADFSLCYLASLQHRQFLANIVQYKDWPKDQLLRYLSARGCMIAYGKR